MPVEHQKPTEGCDCLICCDEINENNYVEYKVNDSNEWIPCMICEECTELFVTTMMQTYLKNLLEADCRASQLRVLAQGPPVYVNDKSVFPVPDGKYVEYLYYSSTGCEKEAKVKGCLEGEEREKWWNEMKEILSITEQELKERESWSNSKKEEEQ